MTDHRWRLEDAEQVRQDTAPDLLETRWYCADCDATWSTYTDATLPDWEAGECEAQGAVSMTTLARHCRSCNAPIYWCVTERGKRMPVDAEPSESGEWTITRAPDGTTLHVRRRKEGEAGRHAHWATCPDAKGWRS